VKPVKQLGSEPGKITELSVSSFANYGLLLGMPYLNCEQAVIDSAKATIMYRKTGYVLQCQRGIQAQFSAVAIPKKTPNLFQEFPELFPHQIQTILPLL
jgi:hypothetical protein